MNLNETLNQLLNGFAVHVTYLTKRRFLEHCRGQSKLYYRSRWNGFASSGYGCSVNAWKSLRCDARLYGLNGRKFQSDKIAVLLLGFDVDSHHGEQDVQKTTDLILSYFPNAYAEPSTNGQGKHIYLKLYYPIRYCSTHHATLTYIHELCGWIAKALDEQRRSAKYDAPLDRIRGLPTIVRFDRTSDGKVRMRSHQLKDGTIVEKPMVKVAVRTMVIKIPFYGDCSAVKVKQFAASPFYSLGHLIGIQDTLHHKGYGWITYDYDDSFEQDLDAVYATSVDPEKLSKTYEPITYTTSVSPGETYARLSSNLATIQDSHERRVEFAMLLARQLRRVPMAAELEREYRDAGLHRAESKSDADPLRFQQIVGWLSKAFCVEKLGFSPEAYQAEKQLVEDKLTKRVCGLKLEWSKWSRMKCRPISIEKLSALWWLLMRSQGEQPKTRFSYAQAQQGLLKTLNIQKTHRGEIAAMFSTLEQAGLIERSGGYCPDKFGQGWVVNDL
jgi:hypothetical protein